MNARGRWKIALALAATVVLAACGGNGGGSSSSGGGFDAENYFRGKTVRVIITHNAGGGSDLYGRFIASRLGEALPGKPRVTVTNVDGLGGIGDIFSAKADDLVIGVSSQASELYTTVLDPASTIDPSKIRMIGGTGADPRALTLFTEASATYGSEFGKAAGSTTPQLKWAQTVGSATDVVSDSFLASWLCDTLKAPCDMVSVAADDSTDINLMVQRKELNTQLGTVVTMMRDYSKQLVDGSVKIAFEYAQDSHTKVTPPEGVKVPDIMGVLPDSAKADYDRILPIISGGGLGKHFWVGPATSDDVLNALRTAYSQVVGDPKNVDHLQSTMSGESSGGATYKYEVSAVSGEDAQKAYQTNADSFQKNLSYYEELQKKYYDQFWK